MADIVERLRELADKGNAYTIGELWNGLDEAADEIERLRARIDVLEVGIDEAVRAWGLERDRVAQLEAQLEAQLKAERLAKGDAIHACALANIELEAQRVPDGPKGQNQFGLDARYFHEKLSLILRDIMSFTPEELNRALTRLANTAAPAPSAPPPVAYLDIGAGGYTDVGSDLSDEQLSALPKGRHMLGIIGTYGVDGYSAQLGAVPGDSHQFKNFHRLLCERFGYTHDERDWRRDQISLIEHIAALTATGDQGQVGTLPADELVAIITRDLCESEFADPDSQNTVSVSVDDILEILERHLSTLAATGGRDEQDAAHWRAFISWWDAENVQLTERIDADSDRLFITTEELIERLAAAQPAQEKPE